MRRKLLITIGQDAEGHLVPIKDTQKGETYSCPQCGARMVARNSGNTQRGSKRPHFAHLKKSAQKCSGNSVLHHAFLSQTIRLLQNHLEQQQPFPIHWSCNYCSQMYAPNLLKKVKSITTDFHLTNYTPDLVLLDKNGQPLLIIEILVGRKLTRKVIHTLEEQGIILIQIRPTEQDLFDVEHKLQHPDSVGFCSNKECYNSQFFHRTIRRTIFPQRLKCKKCNRIVDGYMVRSYSAFGTIKLENLTDSEKKEIVSTYFKNKKVTVADFVVYGKCKCLPYSKSLQYVKNEEGK